MTRVEFIVNILRLQGIEVGRATAEVKLKDGTFPAGSLVVKRNQPYGRLAKILLEKQQYPDANLRTYDDTGWTMGLMSRADVREISDRALLDVPVEPVDTLHVNGEVKGLGMWTAVVDNGANSLATLRYRLKDLTYDVVAQANKAGDLELPAGSLLLPSSARVKGEIEKLGLQAVGLRDAPNVQKRARQFAAARGVLHLGQHAGRGMGAVRVRPLRSGVRFDLQGARASGCAARFLRRDRDSQPGADVEVAGVRYRVEGQAAGLHQDARVSEFGAIRRIGRYHRRHGDSKAWWNSRSS